jgi:hypothetical protein
VGGRVGGFVEVHDTIANVLLEGAAKRGRTTRDGSVVAGTNVELVVVLQKKRPVGGVKSWDRRLRLDSECTLLLGLRDIRGHGRARTVEDEKKNAWDKTSLSIEYF